MMTLEELRELRLISNTNGRPTSSMTDEKWQKEFNLRKIFITPHPKEITKLKENIQMNLECGTKKHRVHIMVVRVGSHIVLISMIF